MGDEPQRLDAPNQQVVRPDGSGPAEEGTGGEVADEPQPQPEPEPQQPEQAEPEQAQPSKRSKK